MNVDFMQILGPNKLSIGFSQFIASNLLPPSKKMMFYDSKFVSKRMTFYII
jgi:hypothetical protein